MTGNIVDSKPVPGRPGLMIDVEKGGELGAVGERNTPEVQRPVVMFGNHFYHWSGFVFVCATFNEKYFQSILQRVQRDSENLTPKNWIPWKSG